MGMPKHFLGLSGKTTLTTDGSRGLDLQAAEASGEQSAYIILFTRKADEPREAQTHLKSLGIEADWIAADGTVEVDIQCLADEILAKLGHVDVLVSNAGATWGAPAEGHPVEAWDRVMNLNVRGLFLPAQQIGEHSVIPCKYGKIINVALIADLKGNPPDLLDTIAYNTSRGVAISFVCTLVGERGEHNITVNAIAPGFFPLKMTRNPLGKPGVDKLAERLPLHRINNDEDLKGMAVLFASDTPKRITGQVLAVDGGVNVV